MQKRKEETFGDIQGVHVIANDFIIAARDNQEHDRQHYAQSVVMGTCQGCQIQQREGAIQNRSS